MSLASTIANGMQMRTTKGGTLRSRDSGSHADQQPCTSLLNLVAAAKGDTQLPANLGPLLPDCRSPSGRTPVIIAALAGNPTAVERLASAGYSVAEVGRVVGVFSVDMRTAFTRDTEGLMRRDFLFRCGHCNTKAIAWMTFFLRQ